MLDMYILTLTISLALGVGGTVALIGLSRTERFLGLFHVRGVMERPRWGGVVFLLAFAATPYIASSFSAHATEIFSPRSGSFAGFLAAAGLVFAVGFLDDVRLTSPLLRSAVFLGAGAAVYAADYRIEDVGFPLGPSLDLGPVLGFAATISWIWLTTNAFNTIDGRDGVSLGVGILAAITLAAVAAHSDHPTVALLLVAMAGAGLGFLPFNLPPATVFIGDSGANVMGFIIGALAIRGATGPAGDIFIAVPIIALGFPILDIGLAFTRRLLHFRHPLIGDTDHIHHRLETAGAGPRGLLAIIWGIAGVFSAGAIVLHWVDSTWIEGTVFVAVIATVGVTLLRLGYIVTLWNSHGIVWVRQRFFAPDEMQARGE